jgi:hypothetical protein
MNHLGINDLLFRELTIQFRGFDYHSNDITAKMISVFIGGFINPIEGYLAKPKS